MSDAADRLRAWATEVEEAYADGGYASGDGPTAPLDEVLAVLAERSRLLDTIEVLAAECCAEVLADGTVWASDGRLLLDPEDET